MSKPFFERTACFAAAAGLLLTGAGSVAAGQDMHRAAEPKELVRTVTASYKITQSGKDFGSEKVTRREYNNNTVEFVSVVTLVPAEGVEIRLETELVLEAESYFPMSHRLKKNVTQGGSQLTQETEIELFANVAVIRSRRGESEEVEKKILPAGAALVAGNGCYYFYQLIFWYDRNLGGRQTFDIFDLDQETSQPGVLLMAPMDNIEVMGKSTPVVLCVLEREKRKPTEIFLDENDRIVRLDQNFMIYELTDWSETPAGRDKE